MTSSTTITGEKTVKDSSGSEVSFTEESYLGTSSLETVATKVGQGDDAPVTGTILRGTANGTSEWDKLDPSTDLGGNMTNGQIIIGSTGTIPTIGSLTAGANITITPGAGTISIAAASASVSTAIIADRATFIFETNQGWATGGGGTWGGAIVGTPGDASKRAYISAGGGAAGRGSLASTFYHWADEHLGYAGNPRFMITIRTAQASNGNEIFVGIGAVSNAGTNTISYGAQGYGFKVKREAGTSNLYATNGVSSTWTDTMLVALTDNKELQLMAYLKSDTSVTYAYRKAGVAAFTTSAAVATNVPTSALNDNFGFTINTVTGDGITGASTCDVFYGYIERDGLTISV